MGNQTSAPEKVYNAAKTNDVAALQSLLREFHRQGHNLARMRVLEHQDDRAWTPLLVASAKGYHDIAELLARNGANLHHVSGRPDGTTALHECVARGHDRVADLLLHYNASPFLENARGLTAIDVAINARSIAMVRKLETRAQFQAVLLMKVPKWGGFGTEWRQRWVVVMPRYPSPMAPPGTERLVRTLLVAYKGRDQCVPTCKVWLDGAIARLVVGYKGAAVVQCALVLHRSHAPPSGAHLTGDQGSGYTLHLRQADDARAAGEVLYRFIDIVNARGGPPAAAQQQPARPSQAMVVQPQQQQPAALSSSYPAIRPGKVAPPEVPILASAGESDEQLALRLQEAYDREAGTPMRQHSATPAPEIGPGPLQSSASVHYPSIPSGGSAPSSSAAAPVSTAPATPHRPTASQDAGTSRPPSSPAAQPHSASAPPLPATPSMYPTVDSAPFSNPFAGGWWSTLSNAPRPPSAAPQQAAASAPGSTPLASQQQPSWPSQVALTQPDGVQQPHTPSSGGKKEEHADFDDDDGMCVVCMERPCQAGFLHGDSVHKCCCRECAQNLKDTQHPTCPMCRAPIDHFIMNFY